MKIERLLIVLQECLASGFTEVELVATILTLGIGMNMILPVLNTQAPLCIYTQAMIEAE